MAQDLIISFLSSVPKSVLALFTVPPLTLAVPTAPVGGGRPFYANWLQGIKDGSGNVIPGAFARAGGKGSIGRVAVMGFSNGCDSGVSQLLQANDAQKIDFVGAFDGIHGSFIGDKLLTPTSYGQWIAFAMLAAATKDINAPTMVITHSSIEPPFPSTTETANLIWSQVLGKIPQDYMSTYYGELDNVVYPGGMTIKSIDTSNSGKQMPSWTWQSFNDGWYDRRNANSLSIFGWGDPGVSPLKRINAICRDRYNCTADHLFQADAVLPQILKTYLVERWNPTCGSTSGFGADVCTPGTGRPYDAGPSGPLANPFPLGIALPTTPSVCPYPQSGDVIIGSGDSPCATEPGPMPPPPDDGSVVQGFFAGAAGLLAGFYGTRYAVRRWL